MISSCASAMYCWIVLTHVLSCVQQRMGMRRTRPSTLDTEHTISQLWMWLQTQISL